MNYIVLDMERNQANSYSEMVKDPVMLTGEIIQIGVVKLDESFQAIDSFNQRVKPCYYREMNPRVANVIKLTTADLKKGIHSIERCYKKWFVAFCFRYLFNFGIDYHLMN